MENIFSKEVVEEIENRMDQLNSTATPKWGKMSVGQMLAHCSVTYEMIFEDIHSRPNPVLRFILKTFIKSKVISEKAYSKSRPTSSQYMMKEDKNFDVEKKRLLDYMYRVQKLGADSFEGKESHSFGSLTKEEWNIFFINT